MRAATTDSGPTALDFNSDREVVDLLVRAAQSDPSPDVVEACLSALTFAHHHGMREVVFSTFVQHTKNPMSPCVGS